MNFGNENSLRMRAIEYIMQRHCKSGGFCFYRLEEPNGSDTYYALASLKLLNVPYRDEKTIRYLQGTQSKDGSFESLFAAFYAVKGLQLMDEKPAYDPVPYILSHIRLHHIENLPADVISIFQSLYLLSEICTTLEIQLDEDWKGQIIRFAFGYRNGDNGFGHPYSTLLETWQALTILNWLSYPIERLSSIDFLAKCEDPIYGFVDVSGMSPSFLEYVHAGISVCRLLVYEPRYRETCIEFIRDCQNRTGGFSRATNAGIATLENTYLAVHALALLSALQV